MKKLSVMLLVLVMVLSTVAGCSTSNQVAEPAEEAGAAQEVVQAEAVMEASTEAEVESPVVETGEDMWAELEAKLDEQRAIPAKSGLEAPPTNKDKIKIGLMPTAMNTHYDIVFNGAKETAAKYGDQIEIVIQAPTSQSASVEQIAIAEAWIEQGFDAIAVCVANDKMMEPTFKKAAEAGIPVFLFNTPMMDTVNPYYVSSVGYSQYEGGYTFGKYLTEKYAGEELSIALMRGLPGTHDNERAIGFFDASGAVDMTSNDNTTNGRNPNFKVITQGNGNWVRNDAQIAMDALLQANPEIDLLFGLYDEMSLGALVSIKAADRLDEIKIYGYDNTPDAFASMEKGEMYGTTDTVPKQMGIDLINTIKAYCIDGEDVPKAVYARCKVWDWDNMGDFSKDNYINTAE